MRTPNCVDKKKNWYDFVVEKEHLFIRNIYSREELPSRDKISNIFDYYEQFGRFIEIVIHLERLFVIREWERNLFERISELRYTLPKKDPKNISIT